jgi:hypothetical protein
VPKRPNWWHQAGAHGPCLKLPVAFDEKIVWTTLELTESMLVWRLTSLVLNLACWRDEPVSLEIFSECQHAPE